MVRDGAAAVRAVQLSAETFSEDAVVVSDRVVQFQKGTITGIETSGYSELLVGENTADAVSENRDDSVKTQDSESVAAGTEECFDTPHGPQKTVCCWSADVPDGRAVTVSWRITYR